LKEIQKTKETSNDGQKGPIKEIEAKANEDPEEAINKIRSIIKEIKPVSEA